jgi:hypothetical protein
MRLEEVREVNCGQMGQAMSLRFERSTMSYKAGCYVRSCGLGEVQELW